MVSRHLPDTRPAANISRLDRHTAYPSDPLAVAQRNWRFTWPITSMSPLPISSRKRSEEHTSELQSRGHLVCRLLLEKKKNRKDEHKLQAPCTNTHGTE